MSEGQAPSPTLVFQSATEAELATPDERRGHFGTAHPVVRTGPSRGKKGWVAKLLRMFRVRRYNSMLLQPVNDCTFDDLIVTPDGEVEFHPNLTTHISALQWCKLYNAVAFANSNGWVLQAWCTIAWQEIGITDDDKVSGALRDWTERVRKWLEERDCPCVYVYVHENSRKRGLHTHVLLHVPPEHTATFRSWCRERSLKRRGQTGGVPKAALHIETREDKGTERQWRWFRYMMKGTSRTGGGFGNTSNPHVVTEMNELVDHHFEDGGIIRCRKRVGASQRIDELARKDANFVSLFDAGENSPERLYSDHYIDEWRRMRNAKEISEVLEYNYS